MQPNDPSQPAADSDPSQPAAAYGQPGQSPPAAPVSGHPAAGAPQPAPGPAAGQPAPGPAAPQQAPGTMTPQATPGPAAAQPAPGTAAPQPEQPQPMQSAADAQFPPGTQIPPGAQAPPGAQVPPAAQPVPPQAQQPTGPVPPQMAPPGAPQQQPPGAGGYGAPMPQPSGAPFARLPGPGWAPERRILIGDALTAFGGLLVFAFSFAPFIGYSDDETVHELSRSSLPTWFSAWATETFMAPLTWFVVLGGLISISLAAARMVVPREREVAGFRTGHLQIGVTLFVFLAMFGYATSSKSAVFGHDLGISMTSLGSSKGIEMSLGWGGYLMLFGALVAAVGAVLSHLEIGPTVYPQPPRPIAPTPVGYPQQQGFPPPGNDAPTAPYPTVPPPGAAPQPPAGQPWAGQQ